MTADGRDHRRPIFAARPGGSAGGTTPAAGGDKPRYRLPERPGVARTAGGEVGPGGRPMVVHRSCGAEVFRIVRLKTPEGKTFRPIHRTAEAGTWATRPGCGRSSVCRRLPARSRVYHRGGKGGRGRGTAARPGRDHISPRRQIASWTDWSPLAGKEVVILPDNDARVPAMHKLVVEHLARLTPPPVVRIVQLKMIWKSDATIEAGDDIVDWLESGVPQEWTAEESREVLERAALAAAAIGVPVSDRRPSGAAPWRGPTTPASSAGSGPAASQGGRPRQKNGAAVGSATNRRSRPLTS